MDREVVQVALMAVPGAYVMSGSLVVTAITAVVATVAVVVPMWKKPSRRIARRGRRPHL
ncbi:hypothetical protein [Winogradskya humida]|uniref:Uncharacterized protein n=1 Tax=Winogradskya humida TaxID=113566 RepID=A0ABQ3ZZY3_9ACTN|nr:hypothetical protein [Actinoplanes humidus]GIE24148.1 hypothetical protein Ahu01nite_072500 [Actinoplanes humidus]